MLESYTLLCILLCTEEACPNYTVTCFITIHSSPISEKLNVYMGTHGTSSMHVFAPNTMQQVFLLAHNVFKGQNIHLGPVGSRHIVPLEITKTLGKLNETMFHKTQDIKQQKKTNP